MMGRQAEWQGEGLLKISVPRDLDRRRLDSAASRCFGSVQGLYKRPCEIVRRPAEGCGAVTVAVVVGVQSWALSSLLVVATS